MAACHRRRLETGAGNSSASRHLSQKQQQQKSQQQHRTKEHIRLMEIHGNRTLGARNAFALRRGASDLPRIANA